MTALLRFLVVLVLLFGAVLLRKADKRHTFRPPPHMETKVGVNPQEEVEKALRPLRTAPEVAAWSKENFQLLLGDALDRNDPCAVIGLLRDENTASPAQTLRAGMEVVLERERNRHELLEELYTQEDSPLLGKPQPDSRRKETRFLNALLYSDQLDGVVPEGGKNRYKDSEKAISTFRELAQEDPDNGAPSFFLGQALRQSGAKKEEVELAFADAAKAKRFDAYYQGVYDSLERLAYDNLASFAWVYTYLHRAPTPDYAGVKNALVAWAQRSDTGKWVAGRLANRLIDTGNRYKSDSPGYLYSHLEYVLGYNLRFTVEGRWQKNWNETVEKMDEVKSYIAETTPAVVAAEVDLYHDILSGKNSECNFTTWQSLFDAYRAKKAQANAGVMPWLRRALASGE